jgi:GTP-binding protein LepA
MKNIRNFSIIAHIDHGKSTLADRMLEITNTIEKRKMMDQVLDSMELERERGITIKMQPVRMVYHSRRQDADLTQTNADAERKDEFLYKDLTYKIRGIFFSVRKNIGLGHKEQVYHSAIEIEFKKAGIIFESKKNISIIYDGKNIGTYQPDFVVENQILIELKSLPEIGRPQIEQTWSYLKGTQYKLALLVNFGSKDVEIKRIVYDLARESNVSNSAMSASSLRESAQIEDDTYILNLIDTPGHIDFSYEVSRALKAVEGSILLVDATQGVQAQTLTTLNMARESNLVIIPVVSKIDSPLARTLEVKEEIAKLLNIDESEILEVSGKTGKGVAELLNEVIKRIPAPTFEDNEDKSITTTNTDELGLRKSALSLRQSASLEKDFRALVFDFKYSNHSGVTVFVRVFNGQAKKNTPLTFKVSGKSFTAVEVGIFSPSELVTDTLSAGEIGYITTGIKESDIASVGDTISHINDIQPPLHGYFKPAPVVWASIYPEGADDFAMLKLALGKLRLSDSSYTYDEETSGTLGRGFRCGFLGMLHLEIIVERLRREFSLQLIVTTPSVNYEITFNNGKKEMIFSPSLFPEDHMVSKIMEPWVRVRIITPGQYIGAIMQQLYDHEAVIGDSESFGDNRTSLTLEMPLRELMRNFFNELKSITSGYASISYEAMPMKEADVVKMEVLVADEPVAAFCKIVARRRMQEEADITVDKLQEVIERTLFNFKIQAKATGRILASRSVSGMKKDVTDYLYGGDITRKMKLREKQKKGKKRMKAEGKVNITQDVFLKMMKSD